MSHEKYIGMDVHQATICTESDHFGCRLPSL
jgi:hypothetical protein